ncbi:iron transporter [Haloprofundus marisrubri]|uniref:Iron transporter n=1 Tax=Haloprofundus marisrubri TaxID=1514971 RepID=A0A0W1R5G1_9EURY|nr:hypothetical protein [Haloprofundus marisrubri]KTG08491.1 iron transporter [Haloprofundus marisrubri]
MLGALGAGTAGVLAGCLGGFERQSAWRDPPLVENRPAAVYVPAVEEGMKMYGTTTAGPYGVALSYSYPHRFWTVSGTKRNKTPVTADDSIHLMVSIWDEATERTIPLDSGVGIELTRDGSLVSEEVAYPMLSQQMGLHYGANYALDGAGTYSATVTIGGLSVRRTGAFEERFETPQTATFEFEFDTDDLYDIDIREFPDRQGSRDAVAPMEMMHPLGRVRDTESLPGTLLGTAEADAVFRAYLVDDGSRFGVDGAYLYVVAATPYNGFVLPMMGLRATLTSDGDTSLDGPLTRSIEPTIGYHYGTGVEGAVETGDLRLTVEVPPQVSRHDGYETAFFDVDTVEVGW